MRSRSMSPKAGTGVRLRITTLRAAAGPGVELLEYRAPRDGRPAPIDLKANDIAHWQITMRGSGLAALLAPSRQFALVSPDVTAIDASALGFTRGLLVRDRDGHAVRIVDGADAISRHDAAAPPSKH